MITNMKSLNPISSPIFDAIQRALRYYDTVVPSHPNSVSEPDIPILGHSQGQMHKCLFHMKNVSEMTVSPARDYYSSSV